MKTYQLENLLNQSTVILNENGQIDQTPALVQDKCCIVNEKHSEDPNNQYEITVMATVIIEPLTSEEKERLQKLSTDYQTDPKIARAWSTIELLSFLLQ